MLSDYNLSSRVCNTKIVAYFWPTHPFTRCIYSLMALTCLSMLVLLLFILNHIVVDPVFNFYMILNFIYLKTMLYYMCVCV